MKAPSVEALFDVFATAYLRGESPDVRAFLDRVEHLIGVDPGNVDVA